VDGIITTGTGAITGAILMRVIHVEFFPSKGYDSPAECIEAALRHPLQAKARADTAKLVGTFVVDAYWTDTDHVIRFSNGLLLHVFLTGKEVDWAVTDQPPLLDEKEVECIGAPPVTLHLPKTTHRSQMDRTALATARIGRVFIELFVSDPTSLWIYCRGVLIWGFIGFRDTERDRTILYVCEDD
jgi:hypothetical protein